MPPTESPDVEPAATARTYRVDVLVTLEIEAAGPAGIPQAVDAELGALPPLVLCGHTIGNWSET